MTSPAQQLAAAIVQQGQPAAGVVVVRGVVASVQLAANPPTVTVHMNGDTATGVVMQFAHGYFPTVGDVVLIAWQDAVPLAWGITRASSSLPQTATGLGSGWAQGPTSGTVLGCRYWVDDSSGLGYLVGTVHSTSSSPAATVFTLPAGYVPATTQRFPVISNVGGTINTREVEVNSSGAVSITPNLVASSTDVYFSCAFHMTAT